MQKLFNAWKKYHRENPMVFMLFTRFSNQVRDTGREYFGAQSIIEQIRWHTAIETTTAEYSFKISNNHTAYYARLLMSLYPERFAGFFRRHDMHLGKPFDATDAEILAAHLKSCLQNLNGE